MHCSVKSCNISDDRFLWKCEFCSKFYHAACIGVQRHQELSISSYMIPLCADCQHHLKTGIDTRKILFQQEQMIESIKSQTDANLRITADLKKLNAIGDLFDSIELQLKELVATVNKNTSTKVANAVSTISRDIQCNSGGNTNEIVGVKNHLTSLFNISMETTRKRIEAHVKDLTDDLSRELKLICREVQTLSSTTIDFAAHCNEHNSSPPFLEEVKGYANTVGGDILTELKSLASAINTLDGNVTNALLAPAASPPSLMEELNDQSVTTADAGSQSSHEDSGGWRILGLKKVWRADWTDYDKRKRRLQQKAKDKARRRKRNNARNNTNNHNSSFNHRNNNSNNSGNSNNNKSNNYRNNYNTSFNNTNRDSYPNHYGNHCNTSHFVSQNGNNLLPPDRELLAAAKDRFSRPPTNYRPTIQFQRGEILNPYPASDIPRSAPAHSPNWMAPGSSSAASCEACVCRHSCFPRN